ncbi:MAG: hypothetical protein HOW73_14095 [Polyangiaceae bacterium]|nr:hypothetical protein [Polyangiaceae bacterium]
MGCVTALAFAQRGISVLLLEGNPKASGRLAGEWLHPGAIEILDQLGVDLAPAQPYETGRGFVVYPDDGSRPIALPYEASSGRGCSLHHERLVDILRAKASSSPNVEYLENAKVTRIVGQNLTFQTRAGASRTVFADLIVGAAGRYNVAHASLGIGGGAGTYSRMAGLLLEDTELPFEGYGHVCLGALGPILMYRLSDTQVRMCIDVPLSVRTSRDKEAVLYESYAFALPESLREPFRRALLSGDIAWATNQTRARAMFGRPGLALVGDAVGHHHPLTALGMTLGFQDAMCLAAAPSFAAYRKERLAKSRVPEMLAVALYEVFADTHDEVIETRNAIYDLWRESPVERFRTMRFLACQETSPLSFGSSFVKAMAIASRKLITQGASTSQWGHVRSITNELGSRIRWLLAGSFHLTEPRPSKELPRGAEERYAGAMRAATVRADVVELPSAAGHAARTGQDRWDPTRALERGARALEALQDQDGSWEGEVVWCPLLAAQYVLAWSIMGRPIDEERKRRILIHFERSRFADGLWGLSESSGANLFVTTLVYVAARFLGLDADAPMLAPARNFFAREGGVASIPSWGKLWLSMVALYRWEGVHAVPPELWALPAALPIHPSRYHCHTRLMFLSWAALYGARLQAPVSPLVESLREELYPLGFESVDFDAARSALRREDLFGEPSKVLKAGYDVLRVLDRAQTDGGRKRALARIRDSIRWELRATSHMAMSPLTGLLDILALWSHDTTDADVDKAVARFDGWMWEDDREGTRVTGVRSAIWDTGLAARALSSAALHVDVRDALTKADSFLHSQQIRETFDGHDKNFRIDPKGGYPYSFACHGWPVSECTAEATLARLESQSPSIPADDDLAMAAQFILRTQAEDGGFGSYEPRRLPFSLEWLNPAEMFGDAMAESGNAECTASCIAALARIVKERPLLLKRPELAGIPDAILRAGRYLRRLQLPEGCWHGSEGVHFTYGTLFGIRGLTAAGVPPTDPAIRKAAAWLKLHQRPDGSWGERHAVHPTSYVEHDEGQVVQTAWALLALLEAQEPDWDVIERAARFLAREQLGSGEWPKQAPHGAFFHTAVLEYGLYRFYFPLWALAQFETRRKERTRLIDEAKRGNVAAE